MHWIQVAAGVLNQTPLDWEGNRARVLGAIAEARAQQAAVLCLPELCLTGYGCEDAFLAPHVLRTASELLHEILPHTRGMVVSLGLPLALRGGIFNAACLAADGQIVGFVAKQNLAGEGIHYEPRWFKPWPIGRTDSVELQGRAYPVGDLIFDCRGVRIGFEICEDAWVAERPGVHLAQAGVDLILNPSASHFAFGKHEIRQRFVREGARAFHVGYIYANLLGNEAGRAIYDGDAMIASGDQLLALGPRFSYRDFHVVSTAVDLDRNRMRRARQGGLPPTAAELAGRCVNTAFTLPVVQAPPTPLTPTEWERGPHVKEEEFARCVALGLFDYLRKSHSRGFVVSLSGGADSTAVAALCGLALRWSWQELGAQTLQERLGLPAAACRHLEDLLRHTLTCVYQATRNSGEITRTAAQTVAQALGATFHTLNIEVLVAEYERLMVAAIGRELDWSSDDVARQNIQARARSPGVWMLANLRNALLLSTSNRSEAAVGYATMDGDTSGGLAPIAGIDKAFLRHWLTWLEQTGPRGVGPLPALRLVNVQAPTAELRPPEAQQTDEADLMPYPVLDAIERAAIRDKLSPLETLLTLLPLWPAVSPAQLGLWIERFFRLWCRNQWKRERYAPSFHVDDENLDPKTWCRFPILSGGFARELRAMRSYVEQLELAPDSPAPPSD